jgi:hypothetical protein
MLVIIFSRCRDVRSNTTKKWWRVAWLLIVIFRIYKARDKKRGGGKGSLPSRSHFNSSCLRASIARMLKLLMTSSTPEAPSSSCFYVLHAPIATTLKLLMMSNTLEALPKLWQWKWTQKGGGWGGGQQHEGGRWVGRKKRVGRSFRKKTWGQGWAKKKVIIKLLLEKKTELGKKSSWGK